MTNKQIYFSDLIAQVSQNEKPFLKDAVNSMAVTVGEILALYTSGELNRGYSFSVGKMKKQVRKIADLCVMYAAHDTINISRVVTEKMHIIEQRYPVDQVKGRSDKYTTYTSQEMSAFSSQSDTELTIAEITEKFLKIVSERNWQKFHTGHNLACNLFVEIGELMEHHTWILADAEKSALSTEDSRRERGYELSDILCTTLLLARFYNISLF